MALIDHGYEEMCSHSLEDRIFLLNYSEYDILSDASIQTSSALYILFITGLRPEGQRKMSYFRKFDSLDVPI